tara:strand:- start:1039 stop:1185 length:147 start_codon:yes stop_codon:yes gene_type:complete
MSLPGIVQSFHDDLFEEALNEAEKIEKDPKKAEALADEIYQEKLDALS